MQYKVGESLTELPKKNTFNSGRESLFESRGWDKLLMSQPDRWVVLDTQPKVQGKSSGGAYWSRAKSYNKKYDMFEFAVRKINGTVYMFGRYTTPTTNGS
tara:strand:- start:2508 stop:2807 length:300 start_codon:yes stop_codon:yes gene_type:complete